MIIERSEGRVFGARYWTVHPVMEPNWIYDHQRQWDEMLAWVIDMFGPTSKDGVWTPSQRWYVNNAKFWFRDEKDMMVFLLKWQ